MTIAALRNSSCLAILGVLSLTPSALVAQSAPRNKPGIRKLECRKAEGESSIRIAAVDVTGMPADGLWIDAITKGNGREQSVQIDADGFGKLWVGRDRAYEIHAYGLHFAGYLKLQGVQVPLHCELQLHVTVHRDADRPSIIY